MILMFSDKIQFSVLVPNKICYNIIVQRVCVLYSQRRLSIIYSSAIRASVAAVGRFPVHISASLF